MQYTNKTAIKMLLERNGIQIGDGADLDDISNQLEEEADNIKTRIDSLVNRYGLIQNAIGAVKVYKIQHGEDLEESSSTVIPS